VRTGGPGILAKARRFAGRARLKALLTRDVARWKWSRLSFGARNIVLRNRPIPLQISEVSFQLLPKGQIVAELWSGLRFEHSELEFILSVLQPGMTFLDLGGNVGLFAVAAAKKIGGRSVYTLEPCSSTYEILQQNLFLNQVMEVHALRTAIGDSIGEATLQINASGSDGLNTIGEPAHPYCQIVGTEKVPLTTLEAFLADQGIDRVDVMKVDLEGAELLAFRGGERLLRRPDAPVILYESHGILTKGFGYHTVEIMWLLQDCGYKLFRGPRQRPPQQDGDRCLHLVDSTYEGMIVAAKPTHPAYRALPVERA